MATSYLAKSDQVLGLQLKVQEITVTLTDSSVVSTSGSTVTIDIGETISEVRQAIFVDNSAGTAAPVVAASRSISTTTVTLTLSAAFATNDSITLKYVVSE